MMDITARLNGRMPFASVIRAPRTKQRSFATIMALAGVDALRQPKLHGALVALAKSNSWALPASQRTLNLAIKGGIDCDDHRGSKVSVLEIEARIAAAPHASTINVDLDSVGGHVKAAQRIYNTLRAAADRGVQVNTTVARNGYCSSAAWQIFLAGDWREAHASSRLLIHASAMTPGNGRWTAQAHRKAAARTEEADRFLAGLYAKRTGRSAVAFSNEMKNETELSMVRAVELGLVHAVFK